MSTPELNIRVDTRERGKIIQRLEGMEGVHLAFEEMDVGDYILPNDMAIERKSATDFILSVVDKTIWDKVAKLKSQHEQVVYIIEGPMKGTFSIGWNVESCVVGYDPWHVYEARCRSIRP